MIILAPALIVCLFGLILYVMAGKPEAKELGRIMFGVGLFFCLWSLSNVMGGGK